MPSTPCLESRSEQSPLLEAALAAGVLVVARCVSTVAQPGLAERPVLCLRWYPARGSCASQTWPLAQERSVVMGACCCPEDACAEHVSSSRKPSLTATSPQPRSLPHYLCAHCHG